MLRDFIPEEKGVPAPLVAPGRDFIPEKGLSFKEASLKKEVSDEEKPPPGMAPLLNDDFVPDFVPGTPPQTGKGKGGRPKKEEPPVEEAAPTVPEVERPPVPEPGLAPLPEAPEGYEFKGLDSDGEPIFRKKKADKAKEKSETVEAGAKGGQSPAEPRRIGRPPKESSREEALKKLFEPGD